MQVEGVGTSFVLYFRVDGRLATAGATCESGPLLLGKYTIEQDRSAGEEGGIHAAHSTFATQKPGVHHVRVHVADAALSWWKAGEREVARFQEAGARRGKSFHFSLPVARTATNALATSPPLALEGAGYAPGPPCIVSALLMSICTSWSAAAAATKPLASVERPRMPEVPPYGQRISSPR
ncbi:hypothetical protein FB107DRAFT_273524 [Schizophyllum commune]